MLDQCIQCDEGDCHHPKTTTLQQHEITSLQYLSLPVT